MAVELPPAPVAPPVRNDEDKRPKSVICDFCGCRLARDGGVLETGDKAKEYRRAEDRIDALQADVARLEGELATAHALVTTARAELDALTAKSSPSTTRY